MLNLNNWQAPPKMLQILNKTHLNHRYQMLYLPLLDICDLNQFQMLNIFLLNECEKKVKHKFL